ncbi:MAG: dienelactone hydrolase family protein, partial [Sneathiella sp.]|nr:dienelactone hydrolase family protein [Sneathiella sp.]
MGELIKLTSEDGHEFSAFVAQPTGVVKGSIIVVQEIFGINSHMRSVCEQYASHGFTAIAPALFDRISRDVELEYNTDGVKLGLEYKNKIEDTVALTDIKAAADHASSSNPTAIVGYCWGGTLAFLAACDLDGISKA